MGNTIELEGELKLRLSSPGARLPTVMYVGMFAGRTLEYHTTVNYNFIAIWLLL